MFLETGFYCLYRLRTHIYVLDTGLLLVFQLIESRLHNEDFTVLYAKRISGYIPYNCFYITAMFRAVFT